MSSQKDHEFMVKLDKCYNVVLQNSAKNISANEVAKKLGVHRTTAYSYLNSLELMGKVVNEHGTWCIKKGEQTIRPLEKEIVIELPLPRKECQRMALLEEMAQIFHEPDQKTPNFAEILLEKFRETRTIRIKGKNVDDLDLEKVAKLVQHASEKSLKAGFKGLLKKLKS